jgi:hypothetical protein
MIELHMESTQRIAPPSIDEVMGYEAPFLIEKLLKEHIVETPAEAERLFTEVKRYLLLVRIDRSKLWEMYSLRIDEVWHQFILFTNEYIDFCRRCFGGYIPHSPSNAPVPETFVAMETATFDEFAVRYEEMFGEALPDVWRDETSVTIDRRVLNDNAGVLAVRSGNGMAELVLDGDVLMSVDDFAFDALAFIARIGAFYVRELPGDLDDEEKVALVATLVKYYLLRVGS